MDAEYVNPAIIVEGAPITIAIIIMIVFDLHSATKVIFCIEAEGCGLVQDIVWILPLVIGLSTSSKNAFGVATPGRLYKTTANWLSRNYTQVLVCSIWALAPIKTGFLSDCTAIVILRFNIRHFTGYSLIPPGKHSWDKCS